MCCSMIPIKAIAPRAISSQPTPDGQPPLFTDHQFEALGAPRNPKLAVNADLAYYDLGICGPYRTDVKDLTQYCGMFLTPTLRILATRQVFFHNGVFHDLQHVLDFYNFRDTGIQPRSIPLLPTARCRNMMICRRNMLPNVDTADPPLDRTQGQKPGAKPWRGKGYHRLHQDSQRWLLRACGSATPGTSSSGLGMLLPDWMILLVAPVIGSWLGVLVRRWPQGRPVAIARFCLRGLRPHPGAARET